MKGLEDPNLGGVFFVEGVGGGSAIDDWDYVTCVGYYRPICPQSPIRPMPPISPPCPQSLIFPKKSYICPEHHQYIMKITIQHGPETMLSLSGQLDTLSAVEFEKEIRKAIDSTASNIVIDGKDLTYISSAGLRLLLTLRKGMAEKGGTLKLHNIREEIMEIFRITGFSSILDIE